MTDPAHLLLVDDEELNRDMLSRRLEAHGYVVTCASSGTEALALILQSSFDAVLLDVQMPLVSGYDVLREVRKVRPSGMLPIIMVTARDRSEDLVAALELGANDFIVKPVDFPVALARIRTQLLRKQAEDRLRESEERYALAIAGANDGLWDWNLKTGQIYYSPRWKALFGYEEGDLSASPNEWFDRVHEADLPGLRDQLDAHMSGQTPHLEIEYQMRHASGTYRWILTRGLAVRDASGRTIRLAGSFTDITGNKVADVLTSLPNRVLLTDRLLWCIEHARRHPEFVYGVLFIDLDGFKSINDRLGHLVGDRLLVAVARRLERCLRSGDAINRFPVSTASEPFARMVARHGGDEFTILLPDVREATDPIRVAQRVLDVLSQPFSIDDRELSITASVGVVVSGSGGATPDAVLRNADIALYRAKALGKARYEVFDEDMRDRVVARLDMETALRGAIERGELVLHYQPIVQLDTEALVGFEALVRWQHPELGLLQPPAFIPLAEETGLIVPLGRWALRESCRQLAEWRDAGCDVSRICVSVNLSSRGFQQADLVEDVGRFLTEHDLEGRNLEIEITESTAMENADAVVGRLSQLKASGISISIDDFGTGHSSLAYLHRFPIDRLKIDRSFVARVLGSNDDDGTPIVRAILALAQHIGIAVVAEGVERLDQRELLCMLRCELGQGFLFSPPVPARTALEMIRAGSAGPCAIGSLP